MFMIVQTSYDFSCLVQCPAWRHHSLRWKSGPLRAGVPAEGEPSFRCWVSRIRRHIFHPSGGLPGAFGTAGQICLSFFPARLSRTAHRWAWVGGEGVVQ